jgi:hypothetical protein
MRKPEMRNLERLRHWQGEKLKRADFTDQAAYDARRVAWHNGALHETFGIVAGLAVSVAAGKVTVAPGLGYDAQGNPLWLGRPAELPLPVDVADREYYLVLGVPRDCGCGCAASGAGLEWVAESEWTSCDGLPLVSTNAAAGVAPCTPKRIRALERPRLYTGETVRGRTPWELWEVTVPGQTAKVQAGVQTRIDTSAYGFTAAPHYFASLQAPVWNSSGNRRPEFAPTYLPHVASATPEGFTFRLLLKDIALRSFGVAQTTARVRSISKASFESLELQLEAPSTFAVGDAVTLARPRGTRASIIRDSDEELLQLDSTLGLAAGNRVALGNLPRFSRVQSFQSSQRTRVQLAGTPATANGAIVAYIATDGTTAAARVVSANSTEAVLDRLWTPPEADRELRVSQAGAKAVRVTAAPAVQGAGLKVQVGAARISNGDWVVALPPTGQKISAPVRVTAAGDTEVTLAEPIDGLAKNHRLMPLTQAFAISGLRTEAGTGMAQLDSTATFAEGDLVSVAERPASLAIVLRLDGGQATLETGENFVLNANEHLVAANWEVASTLLGVFFFGGAIGLLVFDSSSFRTGDLLMKWQNPGGPAVPAEPRLDQLTPVMATGSGLLFTQPGQTGFARGEVVLAARFPLVTSFVSTESGGRLRVADTGLRTGDWIAPLDSATEFRIVQLKEQVSPDLFVTSAPLDSLATGAHLGVVHFGRTGEVAAAQAGDPPNSIRLTEAVDSRGAGDFVAPWTHFFDNAPFSIVEQSAGSRIVLSAPNRFAGDGVVPAGLIDDGILALASLTLAQRRVRLDAGDVVNVNDEVTASGLGPLENDQSVPMSAAAFDAASARAVLDPRVGVQDYSFRPERLNLLSAFNESFPEQFAIFAQRQGLSVSWTACQDVDRSDIPVSDPPAKPCDETTTEDPCPCPA